MHPSNRTLRWTTGRPASLRREAHARVREGLGSSDREGRVPVSRRGRRAGLFIRGKHHTVSLFLNGDNVECAFSCRDS